MNRRRLGIVAAAVALALLLLFLAWPSPSSAPNSAAVSSRKAKPPASPSIATSAGPAPVEVSDEDPGPEATDEKDLAALAKELENDPNTQVVCDLAMPVERSTGYLAVGGHSDMNGRMVQIVDGKAYLPLVYDLGEGSDVVFEQRSGMFSLEGYGPVSIAWSDPPEEGGLGHCTGTIEPEPGRASLTGSLTLDPSGDPAEGGWVEGCGNMAMADDHGIVHMDIVAEPCSLIAMRRDGQLRTMSEVVQVDPVPGVDVVVDFVIPEGKRGGLGIQIGAIEGGLVIDGVIDGGPAASAGIQEGDLVVAVDGDPVVDIPLNELGQAIGGLAGTDVTLSVDRAGHELEITVTREVL